MQFLTVVLVLLISSKLFALDRFTVLNYNVENLFDTKKEKGKNDWTFLPSSFKGKKKECDKISYWRYKEACHEIDWTERAFKLKLQQIKKYVESIDSKMKPLFIGLSEIENENAVKLLAKELGYNSYQVSSSPDRRGVDVALLYNQSKDVQFVSKKEHVLVGEYFKKKPSRNILEVNFKLNQGTRLTFFVNHWPSLGNPTKTRIIAAKTLKKRMLELNKKGHYLIALGDFNTIPENYPRPFEDILLKNSGFLDVHKLFKNDRTIDKKLKKSMPLGTYFYAPKMSWSLLDRIFINRRLNNGKGLNLDKKSYMIHTPDFSVTDYNYDDGYSKGSSIKGVPFGYNHRALVKEKAGYSDHFGVLATFSYR